MLSLVAFVALVSTALAADPLTLQLRVQNNSGQSGTAILTDLGNNTTKVVIDLGANSPAGPQPAHLHTGTCSNLGAVKYPLTNVANGKSETTVNVALSALLAEPYAVNVHKSTTEAAIYVSCAEVVQTPTAAPRTGGGYAANQSPLLWVGTALLLIVTIAGTTYVLRRREI